MKYPKLRELKEAVISLVTPAYTSKFPDVEHVPFKDFRGKPVVDDANCVGCETCANVCPPLAITFTDDREKNPYHKERLRQVHLLRTMPGALHHRERR
ncbi:MAG: 4Fe-4S binding protein [Bacteroidales bacterium]|nr:4Fe-4S binding protein [Bacteroidales bacterium]